jgi:hypothetical protein
MSTPQRKPKTDLTPLANIEKIIQEGMKKATKVERK